MAAESIVLGLLALLLVFVVFRFSHWAVCCVYQGFAKKHFEGIERVRKERTFGDKGRNALLVGAIAILSLSFASPAFATDFGYVFYGPITFTYEGATTYEVGIVAENQYNAAAYMLGYDPNSEEFTPEVKALLSNSDTGTAFYGFAQNFEHPREAGSVFSPEFWSTANAVYGHEYVWRGTYTQTGKLAAQIALEAILNGGGSSGAGTGGVVDGDWITFTGRLYDYTSSYYRKNVNFYSVTESISFDDLPETISVSIPVEKYNQMTSFVGDYSLFVVSFGNYSSYYRGPSLRMYQNEGDIELRRNTSNSSSGITIANAGNYATIDLNTANSENLFISKDNANVSTGTNTNAQAYNFLYVIDGGEVLPPTNWPVPVDPHIWQAPPLPEPTMPIYPDPVDEPIYTPDPTMPIPTPEDGPTYTTVDLSAVLDAMNRHCIHLQNAIYGSASQFWGLLSSKMTSDLSAFTAWLGDWLEVIADNITDGILHLENYLHSLAVWLAEQFDYSITASEYNDGSVVAWLKRIWAKLGTGSVNTRPDDPVADPIGIGDWLGSFFAGLLNDLKGLIDSILGEFGTDLETLITKFPISIPWDVAIVLGALVAPPQVPHIEYPMYTVGMGGIEYVTDVVIDLSDWSDIMGVVRNFELLTFGGFLAMKTKHFMELMEGVDV